MSFFIIFTVVEFDEFLSGSVLSLNNVNPFLFSRGLSSPSSVQTSLTQNCLKLTLPGFPHNLLPVSFGDIGLIKTPGSSIGLEIRPQRAFTAFRALLPSANYSAENLSRRFF